MINKTMFIGEPTIKDYREMVLEDILREYLLFKGTIDEDGHSINTKVSPKDLVSSGIFVYGLKNNPTNRNSITYYCEKQARQKLWMAKDKISIPMEIWEECNEALTSSK